MARFWVSAAVEEEDGEDEIGADNNDDDNDTTAASNTRRTNHAQHCDHGTNNGDDEASGIWKHDRWHGPLVQMTAYSPQNDDNNNSYNGADGPSSSTEQFYFPGSLPSVAVPRRRQVLVHRPLQSDDADDDDEDYVDEYDHDDDDDDADRAVEEYEHYQHQMNPHDYRYPYESHRPPKPLFSWFRIFWLALIAHLLARYGPVAPPPDHSPTGTDHHGPSTTPPQSQQPVLTWEDFWVQELRSVWRSAKLLGYTMPKYVMEWVARGVWDDLQEAYRRYIVERQFQAEYTKLWANCTLQLPRVPRRRRPAHHDAIHSNHRGSDDVWDLEYTPDTTEPPPATTKDPYYRVVGQSRAVHATIQALDAWEQAAPLLLYFAGSTGTGKLELAKQISRRVFGHCCRGSDGDDDDTNGSDIGGGNNYGEHNDVDGDCGSCRDKLLQPGSSSPVLILQGRDFAAKEHSEHGHEYDSAEEKERTSQHSAVDAIKQRSAVRAVKVQLYETILRHADWHPNGTVVILQHPEESTEGLLATLVQDLTQPSRHISTTQDRIDGQNQQSTDDGTSPPIFPHSLASRLHQACRKTIFIITSHIGSRTIANSIRSYGGIGNIPALELDIMLMHELDTQYVESASQSAQKRRTPVLEVGSKFHAVAPFYPLTQSSLAHILRQKIEQWSRQQSRTNPRFPSSLQSTQEFLDAVLGSSRVEYLTVVKRPTQTPLLTFSSVGAQFLREGSPVMNSWEAALKRCLRDVIAVYKANPEGNHGKEETENEHSEVEALVSSSRTGDNTHRSLSQPISENAILHYDNFDESAVVLFCSIHKERLEGANDFSFDAFADCRRMCHFSL